MQANKIQELPLNLQANRLVKFGLWLMLLSVGGFLLFSALAPLAKGVNTSGQVIVKGHHKAVQHPIGGIVEEILVHEGQLVQKGQTLIKMNPIKSQTERNRLGLQQQNLRLIKARLEAEQAGSELVLPQDMTANAKLEQQLSLQQKLMNNRLQSLQLETQALNKAKVGLEASLRGLKNSLQSKQKQKKSFYAQYQRYQKLVDKGFMAKDKLLEVERILMQIEADISKTFGENGQLENRILTLSLQALKLKQDYHKNLRNQLNETNEKLASINEQLQVAQFALDNEYLLAPSTGRVIDLQIFTQGAVIPSGMQLMRIVPNNAPLLVQAKLPVQFVDKVKLGVPVDLNFTAFNQNSTPKIKGEVVLISADRLVDKITGMPYYNMQINIKPEQMLRLAKLKIVAGMPVEVFVHLGERSLLSDLLKPIVDRANTGLTEI